MRFKRFLALILVIIAVVQQQISCCAADINITKSYYLLKYEYEQFLTPIYRGGATEKELIDFFEDIEVALKNVDNLTEANFERNMKTVLKSVSTYRDNRNLTTIILNCYGKEYTEYSSTGIIPEKFREVFEAVKRAIFGENTVDKSELVILYESCLKVVQNQADDYTEASVSKLKEQLSLSLQILKNKNATDLQIMSAKENLEQAYDALEIRSVGGGPGISGGSSGMSGGSSGIVTPEKVEENLVDKFKDFDKSHWSYDAVSYLTEKKVINGFEDGTFRPDDLVKREEIAKIICVALGIETDKEYKYSDVSSDAWYNSYVQAISVYNIMQGIGDGDFGVGEVLTRQDFAVIAHRLLNSGLIDKEFDKLSDMNSFADVSDAAEYARESINEMRKYGIINGVGNNKFAPLECVSRAQAAQIIYSLIK